MKEYKRDKKGMYICEICGRANNGLLGLVAHVGVNKNHPSIQEYYDKYYKDTSEGICEHPNCDNETKFRGLRNRYQRFCSGKCSRIVMTYPEVRGKISIAELKLWNDDEYRQHMVDAHKGQVSWCKGLKTGIVPSTAFGGSRASYKQKFGKDNSNYIHGQRCGGARFPYTEEFVKMRKEIIERDKGECRACGDSGDDVHHIDLNKQNNARDNLILLCDSCHSSCHGKHIEKKFIKIFKEMIKND